MLTKQPEQPKPPRELLSDNPKGFVFGEYKRFLRKPLYFYKNENSDGHIVIVGSSGSQKTKSVLLPSYPRLKGTKLVIDVKGEIATATAHLPGKRKIFNPMSATSCGYDPYYRLRTSDNPMQEAREIAQILIPVQPNSKDQFWTKATQKLLTGFMLHYCNEGLTFGETMIEIIRQPIDLHVKKVLEITRSTPAQYCLNSFARKPERLDDFYTELSNEIILFARTNGSWMYYQNPKTSVPLIWKEIAMCFYAFLKIRLTNGGL